MFTSLVAFAVVGGLLTVTPGPDSLLVLRTAVVAGRASAWWTVAGICTGLGSWALAAALGLAAVLRTSAAAYDLLRIAGAAYLLVLAFGALRAQADEVAEPLPPQPATAYRRGLVTNLANPKIGVFYLTVLPAFVPRSAPVLGTTLLLAALHVAEGLLWFAVIATLAGRLAPRLRSARRQRALGRASAAVFVAFSARLLLGAR